MFWHIRNWFVLSKKAYIISTYVVDKLRFEILNVVFITTRQVFICKQVFRNKTRLYPDTIQKIVNTIVLYLQFYSIEVLYYGYSCRNIVAKTFFVQFKQSSLNDRIHKIGYRGFI